MSNNSNELRRAGADSPHLYLSIKAIIVILVLCSVNYPNRDYLEGPEATDPEIRRALMNTWIEEDMTDVSCRQREPDEEFFKVSASAFCCCCYSSKGKLHEHILCDEVSHLHFIWT